MTGARKAILAPFPSGLSAIVAGDDRQRGSPQRRARPQLEAPVAPAAGAARAAAAPLLPAAARYAACQAAPSTQRTYRSTLRSFALFVEAELGLPATVRAVTLDAVLDYTAWLQDLDEDTDEPRCHPRTVAKQLSAIRGSARWLALVPELRIDPRIQQIRVKAGPPASSSGADARALQARAFARTLREHRAGIVAAIRLGLSNECRSHCASW